MADQSLYPQHSIEKLLHTGFVSPATRTVLEQRLHFSPSPPRFFSEEEFRLLSLICSHLLALEGAEPAVHPAHDIDERLAGNRSNGWRYQAMPDDCSAFRLALKGMDETSTILYQAPFTGLSRLQQATVLHRVQQGQPPGDTWKKLSATHFFEELLTELVELFYSYPYAQNEIGYAGAADRRGWQRIGLNEQEDIEPAEIKISSPVSDPA